MSNKNFIDDIMTLGAGFASQVAESRHEWRGQAKRHVGNLARAIDLVSREEFDAAFVMIAKARRAQEDLAKRLTKIENHLAMSSAKKQVKTKKKNLPFVKTKAKRVKR